MVVWSTTIDSVRNNPGWYTNGIGLPYNHRFGFGVMDAYRLVGFLISAKNNSLISSDNVQLCT